MAWTGQISTEIVTHLSFKKALTGCEGASDGAVSEAIDRGFNKQIFEFVLNENPYDLESNFISANLFYKKRPIADQLVTIFSRKNRGDLKIEHFETDKKGYIEFIVEEGREYLLDSVIIYAKKGDPEKKEPIWHSIWASTTFLVPERTL